MFLLLLIIIGLICSNICIAKVTDKQYGYMPSLFHQDNYDQCILLEEDALYCSFTYEIEPLNPVNSSDMWNIIYEVSSDKFNYRHDHLRHSICVPITCPNMSHENDDAIRKGITDCYNKKYYNLGLKGKITSMSCETNESKYPIDFIDLIVGTVFMLYMVLVLFASFYERRAWNKEKSEYQKFTSTYWGAKLAAFSIPRNWERLTTIKTTQETEKLRCLQGVRFYNTVLVILCHTSLSFVSGPVANPKYIETINDTVGNLFLSSGSLIVSTNFMMASFLLCYGLLSHFENKKEISMKYLISVFINRYIRLTPLLLVILLIKATWWRHMGRGPNWYHVVEQDFFKCRKNWWKNILYINNFVDKENMCLPQTWYLALDTQYFIILLVLVMLIKRYMKLMWFILGFSLLLNVIATFIQNYVNNFTALVIPTPESIYNLNNILPNPQWHYQTVSGVGCFAGPIIGLGYGYIFFKYKNQKLFEKNVLLHHIMHYLVGYGFSLSIILIPTYFIMYLRVPHNIFWASTYSAISRPGFTLAVGYALFGAMFGLATPTKYVLEWAPMYILGRLTYSAYLVHYFITIYRGATARFPIYISNIHIFLSVAGDLTVTYLAALVLTLFLELPLSELQKNLLPSKQEITSNTNKQEKQS